MKTVDAAAHVTRNQALRYWNRIAETLNDQLDHSLLALVNRIAIAAIFLYSARTKVEGILTIKDSTYALFADEYKVPLLPPELAANLATYAEHLLPLLLIIGLFTRLSALGLLGMTAVIQFFVYPDAWAVHLSWTGLLLYLLSRGAGKVSLDHAFGMK